MRALTYYVATSLDGFIAGPDGEIDAFGTDPEIMSYIVEHYPETLPIPARAHLGIDGPGRQFDTVVMGRGTYQVGLDQGLTSPYGHLEQVVFSSTLDADTDPAVRITDEDPHDVVRELKQRGGEGIWLCGGGVVAGTLLDQIDEIVVKRQPLVLGAGRPMIDGAYRPTAWELVERTDVGPMTVERYGRAA